MKLDHSPPAGDNVANACSCTSTSRIPHSVHGGNFTYTLIPYGKWRQRYCHFRAAMLVSFTRSAWDDRKRNYFYSFTKKKKSSKAQLPFLISVIGSRSKLSETGSGQTDTDTANSLTTNLVLSESKPMKCLSQAKHGN